MLPLLCNVFWILFLYQKSNIQIHKLFTMKVYSSICLEYFPYLKIFQAACILLEVKQKFILYLFPPISMHFLSVSNRIVYVIEITFLRFTNNKTGSMQIKYSVTTCKPQWNLSEATVWTQVLFIILDYISVSKVKCKWDFCIRIAFGIFIPFEVQTHFSKG